MASIKNQSIRGGLSLYFGQAFGLVNKILLFPIAFIGREEYWGFLALGISLSSILANLAQVGYAKSIQMYVPVNPQKRGAIVRYILTASTLFSTVAAVALYLLRHQVADLFGGSALFTENFYIIMFLFFSQLFYEIGLGIFNSLLRSHVPLFFNNVSIRIFIFLVLISKFYFNFSIETFLAAVALGYLVNNGILLWLALRNNAKSITLPEEPLEAALKTDINKYSLFMFAMILTSQIATQLDVLMAGHLLALASLALYDFSKNLMSIADMPARVLNVSSFATIRKLMVGGEMEKVREVYNKATFFQFAIGLAVATLILLNLDFLVSKLPPRGYDMVYPILTVLLVAKLFDLLTGMNWAIISVSEHYNFNLMISIATLAIALPAQYFLTQNFGIQGVAMGFLVSIVVMNVFRSFVVYRKFSILPWSRYWLYLSVFVMMAVIVLLGYIFLAGNGIALSVLFVLAFGGYSYFLFNRGLIKV